MKTIILSSILSATLLAASVPNNAQILWQHAGNLPAQKGFNKNIGTAGLLYGTLENKYILVGGGANFPYESVLNKGAKELYSDIYLLEDKNGELVVKEHSNIDEKIAYGASISTKEGIYYLGGAASEQASKEVRLITLKNGALHSEVVANLPFSFENGAALKRGDIIYIIAGKQNAKTSNKMFALDLKTKQIKELAPIPAPARVQFIAQILNDKIYIFSGGDTVAYTDGYAYDFAHDSWQKVADVAINGKQISLLGANSIKLNEHQLLAIGGFNKAIYDDAVHNLSTLKGAELAAFRTKYFTADAQDFKWNKHVLLYDASTNTWSSLGKVPFNAPCGEALVQLGASVYSINGEIKPGVRTNEMFKGTFAQ